LPHNSPRTEIVTNSYKEKDNYFYLNRPWNFPGDKKPEVTPERSLGNRCVDKAGLSTPGKGNSMCKDSEI
jgi:hypothetical protein